MSEQTKTWNKYIHKVQNYETDQMGIVHHSNYIRWYEVKDDRTGMVHCRGTSKHCFIDKTGRPLVLRKSFPELNEAFEAGVKVHKENKKALIKKREDK